MSCEWGGLCHSDLRRRRAKLVLDFDRGPFWVLVAMSLVFVAQEELPSGAVSYDLPLSSLTSPVPSTSKFRVSLDSKRRLTPTGGKWPLSHMKLSEDIHCCTAVLERGDLHETVRLLIVKSVARDDEIVVWFSHELLAAMDVPFLNPMNIQGEKTYKCHRCGKIYEYPNPLKLHLARSCDGMKLADLWRRLADALRLHSTPSVVPRIVKPHDFILKLSLKETGGREKGKVRLRERPGTPPSPTLTSFSSPSPERIDSRIEEQRPSSEPPRNSAFRPYCGSPHPQMERLYPETSLIETASTFSNQQLQSAYCSKELFLHNQAAEIETLVSNLGQSKQGHLCLYCGKIYSRKYGLKIHIRTHTGFKPLKCKYCLRPFGDPSNLNKHVRLHADTETPYRCDLCGKMLVRRRDLDRHIKSRHSGIMN